MNDTFTVGRIEGIRDLNGPGITRFRVKVDDRRSGASE